MIHSMPGPGNRGMSPTQAKAMVEARVNTRKESKMNKVMVFRHDNSDLDFRLEPLDVPGTVTMDNVQEWLVENAARYLEDTYTVLEVSSRMTYYIKQKPPQPKDPEYYVEEVKEFSIFDHEQNGR